MLMTKNHLIPPECSQCSACGNLCKVKSSTHARKFRSQSNGDKYSLYSIERRSKRVEDTLILKEIEEQRKKLNTLADQKSSLTDPFILYESVQLDILLNKYYSLNGSKARNSKKKHLDSKSVL